MRTLFLDKARPSTRRWVTLIAGLAVIEAVILAAYVLRPVPTSIDTALASPEQQCAARGERQHSDSGEWPATRDGRDARTLVQSRCTLNPDAYR
ncbi:MAG: hypothetical protein ACOZJX_06450 [Pseudomonadota bacterium]